MSISKAKHDELCTSYAALALYDGDVSTPRSLIDRNDSIGPILRLVHLLLNVREHVWGVRPGKPTTSCVVVLSSYATASISRAF